MQPTAPPPMRQAPKGGVAAPDKAGATAADAAGDAADGDASVAQRRATAVRQRETYAESAAARGDCTATRSAIAQIRKLDPGYRGQVEQLPDVKRCLK